MWVWVWGLNALVCLIALVAQTSSALVAMSASSAYSDIYIYIYRYILTSFDLASVPLIADLVHKPFLLL